MNGVGGRDYGVIAEGEGVSSLDHHGVEALDLEDIKPEDIGDDMPLFGDDGLGLDSIDALELALAISQRYGFKLRSDHPDNARIFSSLAALSAFIETERVTTG